MDIPRYIIEIPNDENYAFRVFLGINKQPVYETGRNPVLHLDNYLQFFSIEEAKEIARLLPQYTKFWFSINKIINSQYVKSVYFEGYKDAPSFFKTYNTEFKHDSK